MEEGESVDVGCGKDGAKQRRCMGKIWGEGMEVYHLEDFRREGKEVAF